MCCWRLVWLGCRLIVCGVLLRVSLRMVGFVGLDEGGCYGVLLM